MSSKEAILVLEDGRVFRGKSFGAQGETFGELICSTGMTGHQQLATDPANLGQLMAFVSPHAGSASWDDTDAECAQIRVAGLIVRDPATPTFQESAKDTLEGQLHAQGVVGIAEIDTRALMRHIRDAGLMRAGISTSTRDEQQLLAKVLEQPTAKGNELIGRVAATESRVIPAVGKKSLSVAVIDLGSRDQKLALLSRIGAELHVLPPATSAQQVRELAADGLLVTDGPGDPAATDTPMEALSEALGRGLPVLGIGLGHQLLARALGFETRRMKNGHHGLNLPVLDRRSGRVEITTHNHDFTVVGEPEAEVDTPYGVARVSHVCLNDDTIEGLELRSGERLVAMSVQFQPQGLAGPHDSAHLFERFAQILGRKDA